jgi:hypothetical protein
LYRGVQNKRNTNFRLKAELRTLRDQQCHTTYLILQAKWQSSPAQPKGSAAQSLKLSRGGPKNIRVNCIAPGLVRTDFARALWENPETLGRAQSLTPLRRIGEPDDIAATAVFLASRAGAWMTGQVMVIDGGVTIAG